MQGEQLPPTEQSELPLGLDIHEPSVQEARFNPEQNRAFGSVPGLIGKTVDIPEREKLNDEAWLKTSSEAMRDGLYGATTGFAVNGLVLSPEYYEVIIRNHRAFKASIGGKTLAANRLLHPERQAEKFEKSQRIPLESKSEKHQVIIDQLHTERENLLALIDWQRTPGFWRTSEADLRIRTTTAWDQTFVMMLRTLKDQRQLSNDEYIDMQHALSYRLFRGPQSERMREWGSHLAVANEYTRSVGLLFKQSQSKIHRSLER